MQPKKRPSPSPRTGAAPIRQDKGQGPRRPVGMQALGPVRYEQLRRAIHELNGMAQAR